MGKIFKSINKKTENILCGDYVTDIDPVMDENAEVNYHVEVSHVKFFRRSGPGDTYLEIILTKAQVISMYEDILKAEKITGTIVYKDLD